MSRKSPQSSAAGAPAPESPTRGRGGKALAVGAAALLLVAIVAGVFLFGGRQAANPAAGDPARAAALASTQSPSHGEATARVHIVEFLDPACETCALFYQIVREVMDQNPGKIRLSIRHVAFHDGSEFPVRVLEASRKQGKYWETLEILFGKQAQWTAGHVVQPDLVLQTVSSLGMNLEQLMADMNSPEVTARMAQDMSDAATLKVTATPEYFVNGRPLPDFGDQQLLNLIQDELGKAY
jgi:protein-disulfide isomerase